jgi:hypothetical protein
MAYTQGKTVSRNGPDTAETATLAEAIGNEAAATDGNDSGGGVATSEAKQKESVTSVADDGSSSSNSSSDEDCSDDDDPRLAGPTDVTVSTDLLNLHFVCSICSGYFIDAHTITECLHTFCRRCLPRPLKFCPKCGISLSAGQTNGVKPDRSVQLLVDKFFPQFAANEEVEKIAFYSKQGIKRKIREINATAKDVSSTAGPSKKCAGDEAAGSKSKAPVPAMRPRDKEVCFQLLPSTGSKLKPLGKPYLRTSGQLRTIHLKKYLVKKLDLGEHSQIEILLKGEVVGSEHNLTFIRRTRWFEENHLTLHYRLAQSIMM